jgi:hypothetical protein
VVGGGNLVVANGVFQRNLAAQGSALMAISARSVKVSNTSFDDEAGAFAGNAAQVQGCNKNPCGPSESCSVRAHSTFCDPCAANEKGPDGISCVA